MCRRGGSKGGKHPDDVTDINVGNTATQNPERGSNENQNRLVRRKIPKGENFDDRTEDDIQRVEDWINDYPREMFGWKTSGELFQEELARLA